MISFIMFVVLSAGINELTCPYDNKVRIEKPKSEPVEKDWDKYFESRAFPDRDYVCK